MHLTFVCGPPGSRLTEFAHNASTILQTERGIRVLHADIEQSLGEPIQIVVQRPRATVVGAWQEAARRAIASLQQAADINR